MQWLYNFEKNLNKCGKNPDLDKCLYKVEYQKYYSRGTQTNFRDNETQTEYWDPPYRVASVADSKLLALATLRWNDERSVGVYEIDKIKKLKIKNAWQKMITPIDCTDIKSQQSIIVMIDREDRKFYDQELQMIADLQEKKMQIILEKKNHHHELKCEKRFKKVSRYLDRMRDKKINELKENFNRQLRKFSNKYQGKNNMRKPTIMKSLEPHLQLESIIAADQSLKTNNDYMPATYRDVKITSKDRLGEPCFRKSRWTDAQLEKLHADLKNIRLRIYFEKEEFAPKSSTVHPISFIT